MKNKYRVGDLIVYVAFGGERRTVTVISKEDDIKNGQPGFDGEDADGNSWWGYDDQIVKVLSSKK